MIEFILLQVLDGSEVFVNRAQIVSIRTPQANGQVHGDVNCIVNFTDGRFVTVVESCATIRERLQKPPLAR